MTKPEKVQKPFKRIPKNRSQATAKMAIIRDKATQLMVKAREARIKAERIVFLSRVDDLVRRLNLAANSKKPIKLLKARGRNYIIQMIGGKNKTIKREFVKMLFDHTKATDPTFFVKLLARSQKISKDVARQKTISLLTEIAANAFAWSKVSQIANKKFLQKKESFGERDFENIFAEPIMIILIGSQLLLKKLGAKAE